MNATDELRELTMKRLLRDDVRTDAREGGLREASWCQGLSEDVLAEPGWVDDDVVRESSLLKVDNLCRGVWDRTKKNGKGESEIERN